MFNAKSFWKLTVNAALAVIACNAVLAETLRHVTVDEPPNLDLQGVTSDLATNIAHHMFEELYIFNSSNSPVPLQAENSKQFSSTRNNFHQWINKIF